VIEVRLHTCQSQLANGIDGIDPGVRVETYEGETLRLRVRSARRRGRRRDRLDILLPEELLGSFHALITDDNDFEQSVGGAVRPPGKTYLATPTGRTSGITVLAHGILPFDVSLGEQNM
jgi:hypothetical protein